MVALKSGEVDGFLARASSAPPVALVYGPDLGLVRERTEALLAASVDDVGDPFSLVRIGDDDLANDPTRLVDEAQTIPLFGGRRAVHLRLGTRNVVPPVEAVLALSLRDCRVVIEAGDLKRNAPVRVLCERARNAVAIPCYPDGERELARLVDQEMRAADLTIAADARAALVPLLGGDRRASLAEVRKLALYAHGQASVGIDDVLAVVADASALALDRMVDAAFAGRPAEVEAELAKARVAGTAPGSVIASAGWVVAQLDKARLAIEGGSPLDQVVEDMRPPVHFSRKQRVEAALKAWTGARLQRAMADIAEAALEARRQPILAELIAQRTLMRLAETARRKP